MVPRQRASRALRFWSRHPTIGGSPCLAPCVFLLTDSPQHATIASSVGMGGIKPSWLLPSVGQGKERKEPVRHQTFGAGDHGSNEGPARLELRDRHACTCRYHHQPRSKRG